MKNKTIFQRLCIGLRKGYLTPTLPDNIIKLQNTVFIRFIRVLGGISFILIVTRRLDLLGNGLLYTTCLSLCIIFIIMFNLYLIYINYFRIKHMYKVLKSDQLYIHKSPFENRKL